MKTNLKEDIEVKRKNPDMYKVLLHNDDKNSMDHVVKYLMQIFNLDEQKAIQIMVMAHHTGLALVTITHLERAELYAEQMASAGLIGTIEKV